MHLMLMMLAGIQVHWQWAMQLMLMNSSARATRDAARAHDAGLQTGGAADAHDAGLQVVHWQQEMQLMLMMLTFRPSIHAQGRCG